MKLIIRTDSTDCQPDERAIVRAGFERPLSRAELDQSLWAARARAGAAGPGDAVPWLGRFATWLTGRLWGRIALGYEDAAGFHYGTPPANQCHEIFD